MSVVGAIGCGKTMTRPPFTNAKIAAIVADRLQAWNVQLEPF